MRRHRMIPLFLAALLAMAVTEQIHAAPRIVCPAPQYDFGAQCVTQSVQHAFLIRNDGDEPLVITKIRGCCGATTKLGTNSIAPGTNTTFDITLSLRGRLGNQRKALYLETNDPMEPLLQVRLVGRAVRDWAAIAAAQEEGGSKTQGARLKSQDSRNGRDETPGLTPDTRNLAPPVSPDSALGTLHSALLPIDYFYEAGCPECLKVQKDVLPGLERRFAGQYRLALHDIGIKTNMLLLIKVQQALKMQDNEPVSMVVDYKVPLNGLAAIEKCLFQEVERGLTARQNPGWTPPAPIRLEASELDGGFLADRARQFTLSAVLLAGLVDGINPCAISTLVFFMSLLAVSKIRGTGLLLMGVSFCAASFVTYTALGFGLLRALHLLTGFPIIRMALDIGMVTILAVLAFLSFRDAVRFRRSGNAGDVTLQLPPALKERMHRIMKSGLGLGSLVLGGLAIGTAVTALESVCTGQVYIPTLALMAKSGQEGADQAWRYLILYNAMFMVPLVTIFILTYFGLRTQTLLEWSKRNVVVSKLLLGLLFIALAGLMLML